MLASGDLAARGSYAGCDIYFSEVNRSLVVVSACARPDRTSRMISIERHELTSVDDAATSAPIKTVRVRHGATAEFIVHCSSAYAIICCAHATDLGAAELRHVLHDLILPKVLALLGERVLHGALLSVGGQGIAIIGPSGAGKSTLAAALNMRGAELHSDDAFVLRSSATGFHAQGAYPSLRLWPDSLRQLFPAGRTSTIMSERTSKCCVQTDEPVEDLVPLRAIILLAPTARDSCISAVKPSRSCMSLVTNSFQLEPTDTVAAAANLEFMRDVALQIPTFLLGRPKDYSQLPAACDAVLSTLEINCGSSHMRCSLHDQHVAL